jgi:hypothetical protein
MTSDLKCEKDSHTRHSHETRHSVFSDRPKAAEAKPLVRPRGLTGTKKPEPERDDEEESDSEEEMEMDMETLDQSQLIKGEEDRNYLDSLPEIEREAILAERFEQRKAEHDMRQALRESKRKEREEKKAVEDKGNKRKAPTSSKKASKKSKDSDGNIDTSKDKEMALSLSSRRSSTRDRDATGKKGSKAKALAALREVCMVWCTSQRINFMFQAHHSLPLLYPP